MKLKKCKVCKSKFAPMCVRTVSYEIYSYDAMDCPTCGCEVILQKTKESCWNRSKREHKL